MGKAVILQGGLHGLYIVRLEFDRSRIAGFVARIDQEIALVDAIIANPASTAQAVARARLHKAELLSRKHYLENSRKDIVCPAWCADLSETMAGSVGSIEVPGERTKGVNLQPGYVAAQAAYNQDRDGQLRIPVAVSPEAAFYNLAMLPGWQKYYPTYRYGTITALTIAPTEDGTDYCDVTFDEALSSQQKLNVNQTTTLSAVPIQYMDCGGAGFSVGDQILIGFDDQDWEKPFALGYKDHPKNCHSWIIYTVALLNEAGEIYEDHKVVMVWDPKLNKIVRAPMSLEDADYLAWYNGRYNVAAGEYLYSQGPCGTPASVSQSGIIADENGNWARTERPSGCPLLCPEMTDWFESVTHPSFVTRGCEIQAARYFLGESLLSFPKSSSFVITLPGTPIQYHGFRTHYKEIWTADGHADYTYDFISPLGVESFAGYLNYADVVGGINYGPTYNIPTGNFDFVLYGKSSERELTQLCIIQYVPTMKEFQYVPNIGGYYTEPVRQERVVKAHAQAIYQRAGFSGVDITGIGRNTALETQLIAAVNLAYTLNGLAASDLRKCVVTTVFKN